MAAPRGTDTIKLSADTWMKIVGFLLVHTSIVVWTVAKIVNAMEHRATMLEANQSNIKRLVEIHDKELREMRQK